MKSYRYQLFVVGAALMVNSLAFADMKSEMKTDREAINKACTQEATTAGCADKVVGKGLMKCLHSYRKEHKDFKLGEGCESTIKKLKEDRKQKKSVQGISDKTEKLGSSDKSEKKDVIDSSK